MISGGANWPKAGAGAPSPMSASPAANRVALVFIDALPFRGPLAAPTFEAATAGKAPIYSDHKPCAISRPLPVRSTPSWPQQRLRAANAKPLRLALR